MRESNYELLRFLSTFMIVLLHVAAGSVAITMTTPNLAFTISNGLDSVARYGVPLFVMLSGAFQLQNPKNKRFLFYYPRIIKTILIPTLTWSVIYVFYSVYCGMDTSYVVKQLFLGSPYYHLWYLYMALGLFAVTPLLVRFVSGRSHKQIFAVALILTVFAFLITEAVTFIWMFKFVQYLGYYLFGYLINQNKESLRKYKNHFLILSLMCTVCIYYFTEMLVYHGGDFYKPLYFYGFLSPFVILGSIFIFCYFACLQNVGNGILKVSKYSFTIYLSHALFLNLISNTLISMDINLGVISRIPILTILTFLTSFIFAYLFDKITRLFKPSRSSRSVNKKRAK